MRHEEEKDEGRGGLLVGVGKQGKFEIHLINVIQQQQQQRLQTNISILIVDSKVSLVEELKAHHNNNNSEVLPLATYSNSESTVLTYTSIFETLWASAKYEINLNFGIQR